MNPLTMVKRIQNINAKEASLGISDEASWHAKYRDSAYVFAGGIPFDLTEGDLLTIFAQYGEIVDGNLVRNKDTGKSKGFSFIAYKDQRSTILAVDNLNGAQVLGRTIRVDHIDKYKKKEGDEDRLSKWGYDKFDGSRRNGGKSGRSGHGLESHPPPQVGSSKTYEKQFERKDRDKRKRYA